jgi:hypothetical protein
MSDFISEVVERLKQTERETVGRAVTPDEAKRLQALSFLKQIAPYFFDDEPPTPKKELQ